MFNDHNASRDTLIWSRTIDQMLEFSPEYLIPQHTRPLIGKEEIRETLTAYRDAIQYVHDQTVRLMNKGDENNVAIQIIIGIRILNFFKYFLP